jgi:hypothetical protein
MLAAPAWLTPSDPAVAPLPSWIAQPLPDPTGSQELASARASTPPHSVVLSSFPPVRAPRISVRLPEPSYPDLGEENAQLRVQLAELLTTMGRFKRDVLEASEHELVKLACAIAERVVGREVGADPTLILAWAREAIEALGPGEEVTVFVAPDLAATLAGADLQATGIRIETDTALGTAKCEVRTRASVIDASVMGRVDAVRQELTGSGS